VGEGDRRERESGTEKACGNSYMSYACKALSIEPNRKGITRSKSIDYIHLHIYENLRNKRGTACTVYHINWYGAIDVKKGEGGFICKKTQKEKFRLLSISLSSPEHLNRIGPMSVYPP
jgi:hypothetical protein